MPSRRARTPILGEHPSPPHALGLLVSNDGETDARVQHRKLSETTGTRTGVVDGVRGMLERHHGSPEQHERDRRLREAIEAIGVRGNARLSRYPTNETTRKGNLAEVLLAEYVTASCGIALPVYRLRYNPNIEQSMKGDDVLAFDLDADPVRLVVGEAKFRSTSSSTVVKEIIGNLAKSHKGGLPTSLQFVADRLFEEQGMEEVAKKVLDCARLFALDRLSLDYVGMLVGDGRSAEWIDRRSSADLRRLAMISVSLEDPDSLVDDCFRGLS